MAVKRPNYSNDYFLIHSFKDTFGSGNFNTYVRKMLVTGVDMNYNFGHGKVSFRNTSIDEGSFSVFGMNRHANGRDWWIIYQNKSTNCYTSVLLSDIGFDVKKNYFCDGPVINYGGIESATFSPNGEKFVMYESYTGLHVYDFDRCTGELSNLVNVDNTITLDSNWIGMGTAISPNNRFLYVCATKYIFQYDLWATDIAASETVVAVYDGFASPFGTYFNTAQLAPDGKIYISCGNAEDRYHIIDQPNEPGLACNVIQHGLKLISPSGGVPGFPNYRLGALQNSPCDTLTGIEAEKRTAREKEIRVFPLPAVNEVTVDYGFLRWEKGEADMEIYNNNGSLILKQRLPQYSGIQKLNITNWPAGHYEVRIVRGEEVVGVQKMVVVK